MKKLIFLLFIAISLPLIAQNYYPCSCLLPEKYVPAVTSADQIPVINNLGERSLVLNYGQEKVTLLGQKDSTSLGDGKVYMLVLLENGERGWVEYAKIVPCGEGKVINQNTNAFKDNRREESAGYAFRMGEPIIATETVGDLIFVYSKNKTKKGWVSIYDVISGTEEFQMALLLEKALQMKDNYSRKMSLGQLQSKVNPAMQIYPIVRNEYQKVADANPTPPKPMPVPTPPVYAQNESRGLSEKKTSPQNPTNSSLVMVKPPQRNETKPTTSSQPIAQKTANKSQTERGLVQVNTPTKPKNNVIKETPVKRAATKAQKHNVSIALSKTNRIASEKVFACLHPQFPIGTKLRLFLAGNAGYVVVEVVGKSATNAIEMSESSLKRIFGTQIPQKGQIEYFTK